MTGADTLPCRSRAGTLSVMAEEQGIYRGEMLAIMGGLADIHTDTSRILQLLGEDGEEDDEAEEVDS